MRSSLFVFFIASFVARATPIPALSEPGQATDLFSNNLVFSDYIDDNNLELSFLPSSAEDLQLIPAATAGNIDTNTDIWDLVDQEEEDKVPGSEFASLNNFDFDSDSDSSKSDLLVSSEPFQNHDIKFGSLDEYISDPLAKCPLDDYRQAACCGELLSENRFIPNCAPSKNRKPFPFFFSSYFFLKKKLTHTDNITKIIETKKRLSREFLSTKPTIFLLLRACHGESVH